MSKRGLFVRKSIRGHFDEVGGEEPHLKRHLGSLHLTLIGIGAIIGAGIFVITGQAAASYAGPAIILSFIIAGLICLLAGLCYAELAALIPIAGGSYSYSYVAMGEFPAWIVGWTLTAQYLISASTVAVGWSGYLVSLLEDFGVVISSTYARAPFLYEPGSGWYFSGSVINLPAILIVAFVGVMISWGIRAVSYFNNAMVVIKIGTILLFIILGLSFIDTDNWVPFIPENTGVFGQFGWSGILRGAGLVFFAYIGFDTVSTLALDSKNPQRDLPRGILGSLGICTIAYIATALILTGVVSYTLLNARSAGDGAEVFLAQVHREDGDPGGARLGRPRAAPWPDAHFPRKGERRPSSAAVLQTEPQSQGAHFRRHHHNSHLLDHRGALPCLRPRGARLDVDSLPLRHRLPWRLDPPEDSSRVQAPLQSSSRPFRSPLRDRRLPRPDGLSSRFDLDRVHLLASHWAGGLFRIQHPA